MTTAASALRPRLLESRGGIAVHADADGSIRRMAQGDVVVTLFPANALEGGPTNVFLRRLEPAIAWTPLLGPRSPLAFRIDDGGLRGAGVWQGLRVALSLRLAAGAPAWFWHVALANEGHDEVAADLVHAQDLGLAHYGAIRMNEYYVSQYLDHTPLAHAERGWVVAVRQNMAMGGRHPWVVIGSLGRGAAFATDALQLHGLATRAGETPVGLAAAALPGVRRQHEHAMAVVQDAAVRLAPGARVDRGFFGWLEPDHPAATTPADIAVVDRALALPEAVPPAGMPDAGGTPAAGSLFSARPLLRCRDLDDAAVARLWPEPHRHVERADGRLLSFFTGAHTHVVLRAKELAVLRPHGHVLRTGGELVPEEASLTTTAWMAGVFGCLLTQGHVGINRLLSTTRSYLGLQRAHGQRLFVELDGGWHLLDVPSAWAVEPSACRWLYAHDRGLLEVRLEAPVGRHALELGVRVLEGAPVRLLLSHHVALGGDDGAEPWTVDWTRDGDGVVVRAPAASDVGRRFPAGFFRLDPLRGTAVERVGGDELLFLDERSRGEPVLALVTAPATAAGLQVTGALVPTAPSAPASGDERAASARFWTAMTGPLALHAPSGGSAPDVARLHDILPWYAHDALIHYLAPRGLEQYSGGGWGTRDVCQGPVEWLLALGRFAPVRDLLLRVFANQNPDGDWPQWFMFFPRERGIRPPDSHGDIVFWPLLALARYLVASDDAALLAVEVPFFHPDGDAEAERASVWGHVERALALIGRRVIPGTSLPAYGHGDWNDSLQPVDPRMRERLCSGWTATLHHQTFATLAAAVRAGGREHDAARLDDDAARVATDFREHLIADGEIAGFAYFHPDGRLEHMLHPRDRATGIRHRLLPMIHAVIADMLTPEDAAAHVAIIREHLLGADGARLFDRPPAYRGGPQQHFQRAESSSFFGREVGLMYMHAHLRWAEAMARVGDADALLEALRRATPIGIRDAVPAAAPRQANCYYSSSDAAVADRYEAASRYQDVRAGRVPLEGGWRVYSSGAGIAVRLVHQCFLGLHRGRTVLGIDPVIPKALDGLEAETTLDDVPVRVRYRIARAGHGPTAVVLNGTALPATATRNPYRTPGVAVPMAAVRAAMRADGNVLGIEIG